MDLKSGLDFVRAPDPQVARDYASPATPGREKKRQRQQQPQRMLEDSYEDERWRRPLGMYLRNGLNG